MTDRDLIAEGRAALERHAVFGVVNLGQWTRENLPALLDALEAAQRPPLGYVVLAKAPSRTEPDVADYANPSVGVYTNVEHARDAQRQADAATTGRAAAVYRDGLKHIVAEVREVQP